MSNSSLQGRRWSLARRDGPSKTHLEWLLSPEALIGGLLAVCVLLFLPIPRIWAQPLSYLGFSGGTSAPVVLINRTADLQALGSLTRASLQQHLHAQVQYREGLDTLLAKEHSLLMEAGNKLVQLVHEKASISQTAQERLQQREQELGRQLKEKVGELARLREQLSQKEEQLRSAKGPKEVAGDSGAPGAEADAAGAGEGEMEGLRSEVESLRKSLEEATMHKKFVEGEMSVVLEDAKQSMASDVQLFRQFLAHNRSFLEERWRRGFSTQRQRGVVMSAGGLDAPANAFVSLHVLRHHLKCRLPFVIMYWGSAVADSIDPKLQDFFKTSLGDFEFVDASALPQPDYHRPLNPQKINGHFAGWQVKAFSIYAAPFKEVLYLDSDSIPLLDPAPLFDHASYSSQGNMHWPDFYQGDMGGFVVKPLYKLLGISSPWDVEGSKERQTESGQLLFDRSRHWEVLEWLLWLNLRNEVVYRSTYGDKETFRAAFYLAGKPELFEQVKQPGVMLMNNDKFRSVGQLHPNGSLLFLHGTITKFHVGQAGPLPPVTHVTAPISPAHAAYLVFFNVGLPLEKRKLISQKDCPYTLWDMPGAKEACAPDYDIDSPSKEQKLPCFEVPQDSHLITAQKVAQEAFAKFEEARTKP